MADPFSPDPAKKPDFNSAQPSLGMQPPPQQEPTPPAPTAGGAAEHLNIKVTDNNNEVFFKIKRSTRLEKLMSAFCERQGKSLNSVRFLFEGQRVQPSDTPVAVGPFALSASRPLHP